MRVVMKCVCPETMFFMDLAAATQPSSHSGSVDPSTKATSHGAADFNTSLRGGGRSGG